MLWEWSDFVAWVNDRAVISDIWERFTNDCQNIIMVARNQNKKVYSTKTSWPIKQSSTGEEEKNKTYKIWLGRIINSTY